MDIPELEFPVAYPIKVIGDNKPDFPDVIGGIVKQYDQSFDLNSIVVQPSKNGNFVSLRIKFQAESRVLLDKMHGELIATGRVKMVI